MTTEQAMAELAAARLQLFAASQKREAVMLRRVRIEAPESLDTINAEIATARDLVAAATLAVQQTIGEA